jgi:hypothetical protein
MMKEANPGKAMVFGLIANSFSVYVLGIVVNLTEVSTLAGGIGLAALISIGLITATQINNGAFRLTKPVVYLIDGGYRLLMLIVPGALFAIW